MTQAELDRQIASLTGEDLHEIRRLGFSVSGPECNDLNLESDWEPPQVLDWDETSPGQGPAASNLDKLVGRAA